MSRLLSILGVLAATVCMSTATAADVAFPVKPIRVMGQGPGSTADFLSRYLGARLTDRWQQAIVVDNRAGAGGTIATDMCAKSPPDGYTLVMGHAGTHVSAVALYKDLPYDPVKDFAPITMVSRGVTVLVVHPSVPVNNVQELIAYSKQKGNLSYASAGPGTASHLTGELFNQVTGLKILHVPYKSAGFALTALLSAETQISYLSPLTAYSQLKAGKVKALAVSSRTRFAGAPDVPSATEAGVPGMEALLWFGLFAPANTPQSVVMKINQAVGEILRQPEVHDALLKQGAEASPTTPAALGAFVKSEIPKWTKVIRDAGIKAD